MVKNCKYIFLLFLVLFFSCSRKKDKVLKLYCGAGLRVAMDKLIFDFNKKTGVEIEADYAASGVIIVRAEENKDGDLFMPGSVSYVDDLQRLTNMVESKLIISYFVPVILVQKGNPKGIKGIEDFSQDNLELALGNPKTCQIGKLTLKLLKKNKVNLIVSK